MPGFERCSWCNGKGCMCCDAERAKWEKAEVERVKAAELDRQKRAKAAEAKWNKQLADPAFIAWATERVCPDEAKPILRPNPGAFRYCQACHGSGCGQCDEAYRLFLFGAIEGTIYWKRGKHDVRDLRDAVKRAEAARVAQGLDAMTDAVIDAAYQPALDAEYARQFPDGPKPMLSIKTTDPDGLALLGAFTKSVGDAMAPGGGGLDEVERTAYAINRLLRQGVGGDGMASIVVGGPR